jgi:hypothetical protein
VAPCGVSDVLERLNDAFSPWQTQPGTRRSTCIGSADLWRICRLDLVITAYAELLVVVTTAHDFMATATTTATT